MFFVSGCGWRQEAAVCQSSLHSARCAGASPKFRIMGKGYFFGRPVALLRCFGSPGFFALYRRLWCLSSCSWQRPKHSLWKMLEKETVNTHICSVDSGLADLLRRRSKQSWKGSDCSAGELQKNGALLLCLMCKSAAVCNIGSSLRFLHKVLTGLTVV